MKVLKLFKSIAIQILSIRSFTFNLSRELLREEIKQMFLNNRIDLFCYKNISHKNCCITLQELPHQVFLVYNSNFENLMVKRNSFF
jgi:hypothetical protein